MRKRTWIQKSEVDDGMLPVPTQIVSNEEFEPPDQTDGQRKVEHLLNELADSASKRLGIGRREFLTSTGGMAAAFLAMNLETVWKNADKELPHMSGSTR